MSADTVWYATLTPVALNPDGADDEQGVGCLSKAQCDDQLTDNGFTVGGTAYYFTAIADGKGSRPLRVTFGSPAFSGVANPRLNPALQALYFCVGATSAYGTLIGDRDSVGIVVSDPGWTANTPVQLSIGSSCTAQPTQSTLAVTGLHVAVGDGTLALYWKAPSAAKATGYDVHYTSAAVGDVSDNAEASGSDPSAAWVAASRSAAAAHAWQEIAGLSNGTAHRVRVRARNGAVVGAWLQGTGTPNVVAVPTNFCVKPGAYLHRSTVVEARGTPILIASSVNPDRDAYFSAVGQTKLSTEPWPPIRRAIPDRPAGSLVSGDPDRRNYLGEDCGSPVWLIMGLAPGVEYDIRLHLTDAYNRPLAQSTDPIRVRMWTVPGPPTGVTATRPANGQTMVRWRAPAEAGGAGAAITGYKLRWRELDTNASRSGNQPGAWNAEDGIDVAGTSHTTTLLREAVLHEVQVRALNGIDPGSAWAGYSQTDRSAPPEPPPPGGGDGGGGGGSGGGQSAEVRILHAEPVTEGARARFRVALSAPARSRLDLLVTTFPGTAADGDDYLGLEAHPVTVAEGASEAWVAVRTARDADSDEGDETFTVRLSVAPGSAPASVVRFEARGTILDGPPPMAEVPLLPADGAARHGFVRVLDRGWRGGPVSVAATDGGGVASDATDEQSGLRLPPGGAAHFRSSELEGGSAAKGLAGAGAPTRGGWRLLLSGADVAAQAYARSADGFVTPLGATVPAEADGGLFVAFLNPGGNHRQVSLLRLFNPNEGDAQVAIEGTDDAGASPAAPVRLTVPGGESRTFTARQLEDGASGLDGALGDGVGKWRLRITSDVPVQAMSLLESPTGHLANLSAASAPKVEAADGTARAFVPLFPSAADPDGREGFLRAVNRSSEEAGVSIRARDDAGSERPAVTLTVGAGRAVHLNSHDLEGGSAAKGLPRGTGPGQGAWRLEVAAPEGVAVLSYLRHGDGFVTGMNALAPSVGGAHRVDFMNPGGNHRQVGVLRLMNPGPEDAEARVTGTDDAGRMSSGTVTVTVPARRALALTAAELEAGEVAGDGPNPDASLEGALGDGTGKWRLRVESDRPIRVMGLLRSPTGHLANLSAGIEPADGD